MKKKIILTIMFIMFVPLFVKTAKADMTNIKFLHSNDNIVVGGELNVSFVIDGYNSPLNDFTFEYDKNVLEVFKDMIEIKSRGIIVYGFDKDKFVSNDNVKINIENGKITLSFTDVGNSVETVSSGSDAIEVTAKFKTLKSGNVNVKLKSSDAFVDTTISSKVEDIPLQNREEELKKDEEKVKEDSKENDEVKVENEENELQIPLYVSLGINILLTIILSILLLSNKKRN